MTCHLCQLEKPLIRKSHIIPDFMYKNILSKGKKIANVNLNNINERKLTFTGIYDQYILCLDCDTRIIGRYESYASKLIYNGDFHEKHKPIINLTKSTDGILDLMRYENINYKKFKLFLLSILWKANISNDPFFRAIELGKKYEQIIRKMILNDDPGDEDDLQTCVFRVLHPKHTPTNLIGSPRRLTTDGNTQYVFFIDGFYYFINLSSYHKDEMFEKGMIYKDNTMDIAVIKGEDAAGFFDSFLGTKLRFKTISTT